MTREQSEADTDRNLRAWAGWFLLDVGPDAMLLLSVAALASFVAVGHIWWPLLALSTAVGALLISGWVTAMVIMAVGDTFSRRPTA